MHLYRRGRSTGEHAGVTGGALAHECDVCPLAPFSFRYGASSCGASITSTPLIASTPAASSSCVIASVAASPSAPNSRASAVISEIFAAVPAEAHASTSASS